MDVADHNFNKVSHKILTDKLMKYGLDEQTVRKIINWLSGWAQRVMISGMKMEASNHQCNPGVNSGSSPVMIFVNDGKCCALSKFEDDTKLRGVVGRWCHPERPHQAGEMG